MYFFQFFIIFNLLILGVELKAQNLSAPNLNTPNCRALASEYSLLEKTKIILIKRKTENQAKCNGNGRKLSEVILAKSPPNCNNESEIAEKKLSVQIESIKEKMNQIIANNPANSNISLDCKRALDELNLEQTPNVSNGVQR